VKRSGRNESILVVIHICMETTQRISLYSYLYLKLAKTPSFSYYLLCFFFYKIGKQEGGTGSTWRQRGREAQIMCTYANKCKNDTC
jgi:hypothetical protein